MIHGVQASASVLALVMLLSASNLAAGEKNTYKKMTETVKVCGLDVMKRDVLVTKKTGYVHLLWDIYPLKKKAGDKQIPDLKKAAGELAGGMFSGSSATAKAKIDIVEFSERDEYDAPRWDHVNFLGKFEAERSKAGWQVKERQ